MRLPGALCVCDALNASARPPVRNSFEFVTMQVHSLQFGTFKAVFFFLPVMETLLDHFYGVLLWVTGTGTSFTV